MSPSATPEWPAAAACACSARFGEQSDTGQTQRGRKPGDSWGQLQTAWKAGRGCSAGLSAGWARVPISKQTSKTLGALGPDVSHPVLLCPSVLCCCRASPRLWLCGV